MKRLMRGGARLLYRARGYVPTKIDGVPLQGDPYHIGFWRDVAGGRWEAGTFAFLKEHLRPASAFLDVGAWIGPVTLCAARRCARVYAFEPDPLAYRFLLWNLDLNGVRNVTPFHAALGARTGIRTLSGREGAFGTSRSSLLASTGAPEIAVLGWAWDEWLETVASPRLDAIKMDIEGGEFELLPAMTAYLRAERPALHLSLHAESLPEAERRPRIAEALEAVRHYRAIRDEEGGAIPFPEALEVASARNATFTFRD
jgi:FkbM family methyltransferase